MTVAELIAKLNEFDGDLPVAITWDAGAGKNESPHIILDTDYDGTEESWLLIGCRIILS